MSQTISAGRIVRFVLGENETRAAIVTGVESGGTARLFVYSDKPGDSTLMAENPAWNGTSSPNTVTSTEDPEGKRVGSWHWPPRD